MKTRALSQGFALPTVVIASVMMFALLVAATSVVSSTTTSIAAQFYDSLAADAAESGAAQANSCLRDNNQASAWDGKELHPNTSCSGGAACTTSGSNCYVTETPTYRSTYTVKSVSAIGGGNQTIEVIGTVELVRPSTGMVWRTYTKSLNVNTSAQVSVSSVIFGYIGLNGAFFATIGDDGVMRTTGYNGKGQLGNGTLNSALIPGKFQIPTSNPIVDGFTSFLSVGTALYAVDLYGNAYGAGDNTYGQIGVGVGNADGVTQKNVTTPAQVVLPGGEKVTKVSVLSTATFFLTDKHNIYATGMCENGVLGNAVPGGTCSNTNTPVRVALPVVNVSDPSTIPTDNIVTDYRDTYVRMADGSVYGWGANQNSQMLRVDQQNSQWIPKKIGTFGDSGSPKATQVAFDGETLYVLDSNGDVWSAGDNTFGQMGSGQMSIKLGYVSGATPNCLDNSYNNGVDLNMNTCNASAAQQFQMRKFSSTRVDILHISSGKCVDSTDGTTLKLNTCSSSLTQKFLIPSTGPIRQLESVGYPDKCFTNGGSPGSGVKLATCPPATYYSVTVTGFSPVLVKMQRPFSGKVVKIATDQSALIVLTEYGQVWGMGANHMGHLGDGTYGYYYPRPVRFQMPVAATDIYTTNVGSAGTRNAMNTFAIGTDGAVYGAGSNMYGQLGVYSSRPEYSATPKKMDVFGPSMPAKLVLSGMGTTVIYTEKGGVYTVGNNSNGQIGDGTTNNAYTPIRAKYTNDLRSVTY